MNDLFYIKYQAKLMLCDCLSMDAATELAHRRLCDYFWAKDSAPRKDNDFLRSYCKCSGPDWGRVKKGLTAEGWFESGNFFLHRGAIKALNETKLEYLSVCNQTVAARNKSAGKIVAWLMVSETDSETGIVRLIDTKPVTAPVTEPVATPQSESESKSSITPPPVAPPGEEYVGGGEEIPSLEQAIALTQTAGIPPEFATMVYETWVKYGGKNGAGVRLPWLTQVTSRWKNEQNEWKNGTHSYQKKHGNNSKTGRIGPDRNAGTYNAAAPVAGLKAKVR